MVVHHLADSEMMSAMRLRRLIAEDDPVIQGYDEPLFARQLFYDDRPIEPALAALARGPGDDAPDPRAADRGPVGTRGHAHRVGPLRGRGLAAHLRGPRPRARRADRPGPASVRRGPAS